MTMMRSKTMMKQAKIMISVLALFIFLSTLMVSTDIWYPWGPRTLMTVKNKLEGGRKLTVHCKSANDDLGVHVLNKNDWIRWQFWTNFQGTTQFYCAMDWGVGGIHWFDIYIQARDQHRCDTNCTWIVKQNGPCMVTKDFQSCYQWNPNHQTWNLGQF